MYQNPEFLRKLKASTPAPIRSLAQTVKIAREFAEDFFDYNCSARGNHYLPFGKDNRDDTEYYRSRLTFYQHGLEKGLTFPQPKRPFGLARIQSIKSLLSTVKKRGIVLDGDTSMTAVAEVERYNRTGKISGVISPQLAFEHERLAPERIERFAKSRHSIRNFDRNHRVSGSDVRRVIQLAAESTPSVCNRRPFRAYFFNDPDTIHQLLKLQNGNRGFGHTVPALLIVTTRRASFTGSGERNQRWIDGGLFAMTIVWVLHAYGIGSCFLNWSETHKKSSLCRRVADIPASEDIITFIAMGYPAEGCRRALSPSRPLNDILVDRTN